MCSWRDNLRDDHVIGKFMVEEKEDEIGRLRRMLESAHDNRREPSRLKKIIAQLRPSKIKSAVKPKKSKDAA